MAPLLCSPHTLPAPHPSRQKTIRAGSPPCIALGNQLKHRAGVAQWPLSDHLSQGASQM